MFPQLAALICLAGMAGAYPNMMLQGMAIPLPARHSGGRPIAIPPVLTDTGVKLIPDAHHPYKAPKYNDKRGPCPGLNTMANHGYLNRNGIVTFSDIVVASQEAFNMEYALAAGLTAFAITTRGNALEDLISIGGESPLVGPLPGKIDGIPGGLSKHGRFEGDDSMVHDDYFIGKDAISFRPAKFAKLVEYTNKLSDGNIITIDVMKEFRYNNFVESQTQNKKFELSLSRLNFAYGEAGFTLNFFANGTTSQLPIKVAESFFKDNRFPSNWHRRGNPAGFAAIAGDVGTIISAHPVAQGKNDASGTYVVSNKTTGPCGFYNDLQTNIPAVLMNTTGQAKTNVDYLLGVIQTLFPGCPFVAPSGAAGL